MKTLPLFYYPTTWIWVDDNHVLLDTMAEAFKEKCTIKSFLSSQDCLNFFNDYVSPLSKHNFIHRDLSDENYDSLTKNSMHFDVTKIAKLKEDTQRHNEVTVAILDYQMPVMDGLTLAEKIQPLPIQKILLTGNAPEIKAVEGFNHNLIQKFIQKTSANMLSDLFNYTEELSRGYFEYITKPLMTYIEAENKTAMSDPVFIDFFEEFCKENLITEYYLIDKNGSFLCMNEQGKQIFLIVHTSNSITQWLSVYKNELSLSNEDMKAVSECKKIPFFGVEKEAWQVSSTEWGKHFYDSTVISGREKYFFAVV